MLETVQVRNVKKDDRALCWGTLFSRPGVGCSEVKGFRHDSVASILGREERLALVPERGTEVGGVNATLWKEERGVRTTVGDATFEVFDAMEGVIGVRGAMEEENLDFETREGVDDGVGNMVEDVCDERAKLVVLC